MNIVKGVAGLLRKPSVAQVGESPVAPQAEDLSKPPWAEIQFGIEGDEAVLELEWEKYENTLDKEEKENSLQAFLSHFLQVFEDWRPAEWQNQTSGVATLSLSSRGTSSSGDPIKGCAAGHPTRVILALTQEMKSLISYLMELQSIPDSTDASPNPMNMERGLRLLDVLRILMRSVHNQRIFSYYGGLQTLVALMKAAVVQLKALTGVLPMEETVPYSFTVQMSFLKCLLAHVVSIVSNLVDVNSHCSEKDDTSSNNVEQPRLKDDADVCGAKALDTFGTQGLNSRSDFCLKQRATIPLMETGGLNWLVELLRVLRRSQLKNQTMEMPLEQLTLRTLKSALSADPRAQNHFKSIGGLQVLIDGLGISITMGELAMQSKGYDLSSVKWAFKDFQLQVLSLEVLKEAVYGNLNSLQFLFENEVVTKFSDIIRWSAFVLPVLELHQSDILGILEAGQLNTGSEDDRALFPEGVFTGSSSVRFDSSEDAMDGDNIHKWNFRVAHLCGILCSFLVPSGNIDSLSSQFFCGQGSTGVSFSYLELATRWILKVLLSIFAGKSVHSHWEEMLRDPRTLCCNLQHYMLYVFRKILSSSPTALNFFREGVWDMLFSEYFFYFKMGTEGIPSQTISDSEASIKGSPARFLASKQSSTDCSFSKNDNSNLINIEILQMDVISFIEFAATINVCDNNMPECSALMDALERSACLPEIATMLVKSLHRILQLAADPTVASFKHLAATARFSNVMCKQMQDFAEMVSSSVPYTNNKLLECIQDATGNCDVFSHEIWSRCLDAIFALFAEYLSMSEDAKILALHNPVTVDNLFNLLWEEYSRKFALRHILDLMKLHSLSEKDQEAKLGLCFKYFETFPCIKESDWKVGKNICRELLAGVRDILQTNPTYYQDLFRDGECFLHIVTLLNGNFVDGLGEQLCLDVLQTLLALLAGNEASKVAFRSLVGSGYKTLEKLLLDCCEGLPSQDLLNALLDLLVDGIFNMPSNMAIQNEDVITLFYNILRQCNEKLQCYGLDTFLCLLKESTANCASCVRAGLLSLLLDWFSTEEDSTLISKIGQLIQMIGGHSITGKDIRKVFALLRSTEDGARPSHSSLLLNTVQGMLKDEGPAVFFELNGRDSGIEITTPLHWPCNRGFTFSCWARVENFPGNNEVMGLFSFLTESGKGCTALLDEEKLTIETVTMKRQAVSVNGKLSPKRWYFLCITHSTGRTFSGGHTLRYYVDAALVGSEKARYPKVTEKMTQCTIGANTPFLSVSEFGDEFIARKFSLPFCGQLGPVYLFDEVLSSNQILGIFSLGPTFMYSFLDAEIGHVHENISTYGILDAKEGLAPKMVFGFNAQASSSRSLFDISPLLDQSKDRSLYEAVIMAGTRLCYRRILRDILDCVGGVSVFFPLLTQLDQPITESSVHAQGDVVSRGFGISDHVAAEVIDLIASVLDGNLANQQFMCNISGFAILGFLLQSVSPQQLTNSVVSALGNLLTVVGKYESDASQMLVKDALLRIYLNPHIWIYTQFLVQRELYMFLLNYFEMNFRVLRDLIGLPKILDIIRQFYWDTPRSHRTFGNKPLLHPITREIIGERPRPEEISKIRLLLLSLAEMVLRHCVSRSDVKALAAFLDKSDDSKCTEDVLHMVLRLLSHKPFLSTFLEHVHVLGGSQIFLNILKRQTEVIRLQGLQVLGRILVGTPSEKKGMRLFSLGGGSAKSSTENQQREQSKFEPIFGAIADRLLTFPFTDALCATLFDVLLGGASPKQVLQKTHSQEQGDKKTSATAPSSHFVLPQILGVIFKFLFNCQDFATRECILTDLQMLLEANQSNIDSLISEYMWQAWFLQVLSDVKVKEHQILESREGFITQDSDKLLARNTFCIVHCHCICNVKGGWRHIEQTVNFLLLYVEQAQLSGITLMYELLGDLVKGLLDIAFKQNLFAVQPCRDNTLYLLTLIDEMLIKDTLSSLPFPGNSLPEELVDDVHTFEGSFQAGPSEHSGKMQTLVDDFSGISDSRGVKKSSSMNQLRGWQHSSNQEIAIEDHCWHLYDKVWTLISEMNGIGPSKRFVETTTGPSLGQRARGLVESLNIPAAEMAAAVVSGGLAGVVNINTSKVADKAIRLRGEKWPRILFRLVLLYIYKADLGGASRCAQQFVSLLPRLLLNDNEQIKNRLQLFIWSLLDARAQVGSLDDGARFHVISQLVRESVRHGKSMLAMSIADRDNSEDPSSMLNETGSVNSLLQRDRVVAAVRDEINYIKSSVSERLKQVHELGMELDEYSNLECLQKKNLEDELLSNLGVICSSDGNRRAGSRLSYDEDQQSVADKWCHMFRDLTDERGPWSATPFPNNKLTWWKLDRTEDPYRRRMKLKRNYIFDEQLCHPPSTLVHEDSETGQNVDNLNPGMGNNVLGEVKSFLLKGLRGISEEETFDVPGNEEDEPLNADSAPSEISPALDLSTECIDPNDKKADDEVSDNRQEQTGKLSEAGENEVLLSVSCVVITPKRKMAGHLDVMKASLHFYVEFVVEGTGGSRVFNSQGGLNYPDNAESYHLERASKQKTYKIHANGESEKGNPMERLDPVQQRAFSGKQPKDVKRHRRWDISKVKAVHSTRYLLQYTAIEIFFSHSISPVFLNFASQNHAKDTGKLIVSLRNETSYPKLSSRVRDEITHFVDKRLAIEMAEKARDVWRRRELSNFEYLMILNTLAGRSYNDLTQYPVFPWILADYTSETLDFNKPTTFRDLSKPVGALDTKRFQVFEERYQNFFDPDIPSFYYGSHYSSLGSVLYYLLRLEPFTTLHRNLQGGKFDHADRLFHSIAATYANCLSNTSDVKELVPEFFYMPEFLINSNEYHLGVKQDGELLGDVLLPPWAKESPEEFILKNREALESEYVSLNLHHWVDLIFGYKQRGKPAIEAANVFYHLTYEGAVVLDAMEDLLQRAAVEDQIANFGQTPSQLFRKKHPKRGPPMPIAHPLYYAPGSITLTSVLPAAFQQSSAIIFIGVIDSTVILVSQGLMMSVKMWLTPQLQAGGNFTFSSSQEPFFGIGSDLTTPRKICGPLAENLELGSQCFATLQVRSSSFMLTCGHWENSFRVIALNDGHTVQSIRQHKELVTCVSVATDGSIVVTGSHDTTVMVWEVLPSTKIVNKKFRDAQLVQDRRKDHIISDKPRHILCGHDDAVTCVGVSVELDLVVSGSKDSSCILHTLRDGRYVRSIHHPNGSTLSKIVVSQHGRLVLYSNDDLNLLLYSINGKLLATSESNGRVNCMHLSSCGEFLVCSGDKGQVILRSMHSLEVLKRYDTMGRVIVSLSVTPEDCFLVGTQDGSLLVYSLETLQQRKNSLLQNTKSLTFAAG